MMGKLTASELASVAKKSKGIILDAEMYPVVSELKNIASAANDNDGILILRNANQLTQTDLNAVLLCNPNTIVEIGNPEDSKAMKKKRLAEVDKRNKTIDKYLKFFETSIKKILSGKR